MRAVGRLERTRHQLTLGLVALGAAAVATSGGAVAVVAGLAGVATVGARLRPRSGSAWWPLHVAVIVVTGALLLIGTPWQGLVAGFVGWLQVHRGATGRSPGDDRVAVMLTLLQVLLACILTVSPLLAPLLVLFTGLVPVVLLLCHLAAAAPEALDPTAGPTPRLGRLWALAPATALVTVVLFFALPRLDSGSQGTGVGLDNEIAHVDLGEFGDSTEVAARVGLSSGQEVPSLPMYLRATAFDHFDGTRWTSLQGSQLDRSAVGRIDQEGVVKQEITLAAVKGGVLVGLSDIVRVEVEGGIRTGRDVNGVWSRRGEPSRIRYTAWSLPPERIDRRDPMRRSLRRTQDALLTAGAWSGLPPGLDPRIGQLADQIVSDAGVAGSPEAEARAIEAWLRQELSYTIEPDPGMGDQPLARFLFDTRRGHCELFASALAVMLRHREIPSRVVGGFYGGEENPYIDDLIFRQSAAHAWVEAWLGGPGWVRLDATPAASLPSPPGPLAQLYEALTTEWQAIILDYDLAAQVSGVLAAASAVARGARLPVGALGGGAAALGVGAGGIAVGLMLGATLVIGLAIGVIGGGRFRVAGRVAREHRLARDLVSRRGWRIPDDLPPVAAAEWLEARAGDCATPLVELAWLHYKVRYGGEDDRSHQPRARELRRDLRRLPRRRRG